MGRVVDGGVRYRCSSCAGRLVGVAPFESEHPGQGRRLWVAAAGGEPGGRCPFCSRDLLRPAVPDAPPGLAVCRLCEQIWVPAEAESWLSAHAAAGGGLAQPATRPAHPDQCPGCGAPWAPDPAGCCRYCREVLADEPTAFIVEGPPPVRAGGLVGALLGGTERSS